MGDEDDRLAQRLPEREEIVVEAKAGDLVERSEWLVHEQKLRLGYERTRDGCAHLHAAGELARIAVREARETHARQSRLDARLRRCPAPLQLERQAHVCRHRRPRHQRGLLEDKPDLGLALAAHALPLQPVDGAAAGLGQSGNEAQRRRLSAPRCPQQRDELPWPHIEAEAIEGRHSAGKSLAHSSQRDYGAAELKAALSGHLLTDFWEVGKGAFLFSPRAQSLSPAGRGNRARTFPRGQAGANDSATYTPRMPQERGYFRRRSRPTFRSTNCRV